MHRVDDDAGEAPGVEQPFFQVELPRPRLLRQQAPLQPVGEPGDDPLEMGELLVEMLPQTTQLVGVAELLRVDDLVEFLRIGAVGGLAGLVGQETVGAPALRALAFLVPGPGHHLFLDLFGHRVLGILALPVFHFGGGGALHLRGRAFHLGGLGVLVLGVGLLAVLALIGRLALAFPRLLVEQVEVVEQPVDRAREGFLIADGRFERGEIGVDLVADLLPPEIHQRAGRLGDRSPGPFLPRHQPHGFGDRRVLDVGDARVAARLAAPGQRGVEIRRDTGHVPGPDGLDPHLFERFEHGARRLPGGRAPGMELDIVVAQLERHRIGLAAQLRHLAFGQVAGGDRQPRLVLDQTRLRAEIDRHVLAPGDGAHRRAGDAAERLDRGIGRRGTHLGNRAAPSPVRT